MFAALSFFFVVGIALGAAASVVVPRGGLFAVDRARALLKHGTAAALEELAALSADGDPPLIAAGAAANALLVVEHLGGASERKRAEAAPQSTLGFVKTSPEGLLARALLRHAGGADPSLDEDIQKRADNHAKNPLWQLALSTRLIDEGKRVDGAALLQKAALDPEAPPYTQVRYARLMLSDGDAAAARAVAERVVDEVPDHGPARALAIVAAIVDDAREETPEEQALKQKRVRQREGRPRRAAPPKPGEARQEEPASTSAWRTPAEDDALAKLDSFAPRDRAMLAWLLQAAALARGDSELADEMRAIVLPEAARRSALAARQIELSLLEGDVVAAEELIGPALEKNPADADLLVARARLRALKLLPEEQLRRGLFTRAVTTEALQLPFGRLVVEPWALGPPLRAAIDPGVSPEAALQAVVRASSVELDKRISVVELLWEGEQALRGGDLAKALEKATAAREKAGPGMAAAEAQLLDARTRLRQGDREGMRSALNSAMAAAPDDVHVLTVAARTFYDAEDFIPARAPLKALKKLGYKSPAALALEAMLEARGGDSASAQRALQEAESIGADDIELLRARLLIAREGKDIDDVRRAADRLLLVDDVRSPDPVLRAWQADALLRRGEGARAEAIIEEVLSARPNLSDAKLVQGIIKLPTDKTAAAALFADVISFADSPALVAEAAKRRATIAGAPPLKPTTPAPKKRGR